jgi:hypothetical protein
LQNLLGAHESSRSTAIFSDDPGKTSLNGRGVLVQIVAIETQSGLQPERIACAKTGELDGRAEERRREESSLRRRNGDLIEFQEGN